VWAFPAGKAQVFAPTPRALSEGVMVYGFGRRLPRWMQMAIAMLVRVPVLRRAVAERRRQPQPACGWKVWRTIQEELAQRNGHPSLEWIHFQSQWAKQRSNMLGLARDGAPCMFVVVDREEKGNLRDRISSTGSFRVTACTGSFSHESWSVRQYEPLPRLHQPARWNPQRTRRVAEDAALALEKLLPRPSGVPDHWRPMHGDYVPWNVREDARGELWLLDWEDAGWGPPLADVVRYAVAYHALTSLRPAQIADVVTRTVAVESVDVLIEVATFWLSHRNLQPFDEDRTLGRRKANDATRLAREVAAFRALASIDRQSALPRRVNRESRAV
jgi:thiamine kinase-like enzyme